MSRKLTILLFTLIVGLLLVACGGGAQETAEPTAAPDAEAPAEESPAEEAPAEEGAGDLSGAIRVTMWESGDALAPYEAALASFQEKYPNIDVTLEPVPDQYGTKLLAQVAAGTTPDVFQVGDGDVGPFVAEGIVEPLDPYISGENGLDLGVFLPGIAEFGTINDQTMLLTKDYSPLVLYYNVDHFEEAGLEVPNEETTWEELLEMAKTLTLDGNGNNANSPDFDPDNIQRFGLLLPNTWGDLVWLRGILPIIYQFGGSVVSEDGTTTDGYMNSPETIEAVQFYTDLILTHHVSPNNADIDSFGGGEPMFLGGQASMAWTGRWPLSAWQEVPDLNFGTTGLPSGPAGEANALCWAGFAMSSTSENKDLAWAWIKHVAAEEGAEAFADYAMSAVEPIVEAQGLDQDPYNAPIINDLNNVKPIPEFTGPNWLTCGEAAFKAHLERVFVEGVSVEEALNAASAEADACLAENAAG